MKLIRRLLTAAIVLLLIAAGLLWWNRPTKVDMAAYAPADSLVYLESNSLTNVVGTLANTDAWKALSPSLKTRQSPWRKPWLERFSAWTGIGPTAGVIFARAQVAVVMLDLGTTEEAQSLKIKPEMAVVIETHTAALRIRSTVEQTLSQFAQSAFGQATLRKSESDGVEFLEWSAPGSSRQIVATIDDTLVIVGNTERAVKTCLAVRLGQRPSLRDDPEMQQMRRSLGSESALAFGYVSAANAARLLSVGAPMLLGRAPGDAQFERLIASGAAKILGSVGWSSHASMGGIEDRYIFSFQPTVVPRLQPLFKAAETGDGLVKMLPDDLRSLTIYKYEDPSAAWRGLQLAVSSQLDTVSAVIFGSLLKSALLPYGIAEPEEFLRAVGPEVVTLRVEPGNDRALVIARVRDENTLRALITKGLGKGATKEKVGSDDLLQDAEKRSAASFIDGYVLIGSAAGVRGCIESTRLRNQALSEAHLRTLTRFLPFSSVATILTYSDDHERVRTFISTVTGKKDLNSNTGALNKTLADLPYSATETRLGDRGLERRTLSAFGQFSTLLPLLFPEPAGNTAK